METETLYFKDKVIQGDNVEIVFHKEFTYFYNSETVPIVKYTLLNCVDLASKNFGDIDCYNDGVFVETIAVDSRFVFEATDIGGRLFQIVCQKIICEELEYRKQDYIDLIKELIRQRDDEHETANKQYQRYENMKAFLEKEIDITDRKISQASWLSSDKKKFLEGELTTYRKVLELLTT